METKEQEVRKYNGEKVQIGWYILENDTEMRDAGYECAAWYEDYLVKAGKYPVYGKHNYHERDRRYTREINYNSLVIVLKGVITGDDFSSYFCGNLVAEKSNQHIGEEVTKTLRPYDFTFIDMVEAGKAELLPDYEIGQKTFYSTIDNKNHTIRKIQRVE